MKPTTVIHKMLKRAGLTPDLALAKAKSRLWWNVSLRFDAESDARFYLWVDEGVR